MTKEKNLTQKQMTDDQEENEATARVSCTV